MDADHFNLNSSTISRGSITFNCRVRTKLKEREIVEFLYFLTARLASGPNSLKIIALVLGT